MNDDFLSECLASIEKQTFKNIEHILNISNSQKSTNKIIRNYVKRNRSKYSIKIIRSEAKGVAHALNVAYPHARGEYIHFLHSDDYFYSDDALEKATNYLNNDKRINWLTGNVVAELKGRQLRIPSAKILSLNPKRILFTTICVSHENTFMKTNLLKKYSGFDEDVKGPVEYRLWLRMIQEQKIFIVDDCFTTLRIHKDSTSRGTGRAIARSLIECLKILRKEKILVGIGPWKNLRVYTLMTSLFKKTDRIEVGARSLESVDRPKIKS